MPYDLVESLTDLAILLEAQRSGRARRATALAGPMRTFQRLLKRLWRKQRAAVLSAPELKLLKEAEPKRPLPHQVRTAIQADVAALAVTGRELDAFNDVLADAVEAGAEAVATDMGLTGRLQSFVSEYLKDGGFQRVAADIDKTTIDRVSNAVSDTYERGGSYSDVVKSIKDTFDGFSQSRAEMISQTELNDAYAQGQLEFGREAGAEGKSWEPDDDPCEICQANADQGIIPIEDDFDSGDDAPSAHPRCLCSLEVHALAE